MQKRNIIPIISFILILLISTMSIVFAWFSIVEKTQEILIYSGKIKIEANLYQIIDEEEIEINEKIIFNKVIPKDQFQFKLVIKNIGTIPGNLNVDIEVKTNNDQLLDYFKLQYDSNLKKLETMKLIENEQLMNNNEKIITFNISVDETLTINNLNNYVTIEKIYLSLEQIR